MNTMLTINAGVNEEIVNNLGSILFWKLSLPT